MIGSAKNKTITITYPDNFEEWRLDLRHDGDMEYRMFLICPRSGRDKHEVPVANGSDIPMLREQVELHNRSHHATEGARITR